MGVKHSIISIDWCSQGISLPLVHNTFIDFWDRLGVKIISSAHFFFIFFLLKDTKLIYLVWKIILLVLIITCLNVQWCLQDCNLFNVCSCVCLSQLRSYNRHTLVADPYEDGLSDLFLKKQKMFQIEKKVSFSFWSRIFSNKHLPE